MLTRITMFFALVKLKPKGFTAKATEEDRK
jgi:hypothetical protein